MTESLSPAASACRLVARFLFAASEDVRKHCDADDADTLAGAARECAAAEGWELDMLQMAHRALVRSTEHGGWQALCADAESEAKPVEDAIALYAVEARNAWRTFSHAGDIPESELDALLSQARAHSARVGLLMEMRDLWFEANGDAS